MVKFVNENGAVVGVCDAPVFIRLHENGCFVECEEAKADGVAVAGKAFALFGHVLPGCEVVDMVPVDGGALLVDQQQAIDANSAAIDELVLAMLEG